MELFIDVRKSKLSKGCSENSILIRGLGARGPGGGGGGGCWFKGGYDALKGLKSGGGSSESSILLQGGRRRGTEHARSMPVRKSGVLGVTMTLYLYTRSRFRSK